MVADANRRGYEPVLDAFWDEALAARLTLPQAERVSGAAFCKARRKIPPGAIRTLVHRVAAVSESRFGQRMRWLNDRRVFAVDGSKINLQRSKALADAYGVPAGAYCPQLLLSTLFNLISKVPHDAVVAPFAASEREHLLCHLDHLRPGDVLVLDRGYPSFELLSTLLARGIDFVIRVPTSHTFRAIDDFIASGGNDYRLLIAPPQAGPARAADPIELRALRVKGPHAEPTVLVTSLRQVECSRKQVAALYRERWQIEEYYKLIKGDFLGQRQFHSKSPAGVEQEVFAVALYVGITRCLMAAAAPRNGVPYASLSPKSGTLGLAAYVVRLLLTSDADALCQLLDRLLCRIARTRYRKRPGRHHPRRSFKPHPKWGPQGRRGHEG